MTISHPWNIVLLPSIWCVIFSLAAFKNFLSTVCDVLSWGFLLWIYLNWSLMSFPNLYVNIFPSSLRTFWPLFIWKKFPALFSPFGIPVTMLVGFLFFHVSEALLTFIQIFLLSSSSYRSSIDLFHIHQFFILTISNLLLTIITYNFWNSIWFFSFLFLYWCHCGVTVITFSSNS